MLLLFCALLLILLFALVYTDGPFRDCIVRLMRDEFHLNLFYSHLFLQISFV